MRTYRQKWTVDDGVWLELAAGQHGAEQVVRLTLHTDEGETVLEKRYDAKPAAEWQAPIREGLRQSLVDLRNQIDEWAGIALGNLFEISSDEWRKARDEGTVGRNDDRTGKARG